MNTLQQIIEEMKADFSKAKESIPRNKRDGYSKLVYEAKGEMMAFEKYIPKLESLLNEQPEAITEDSHLRKHDVWRSAASDEIKTVKNDFSESSSETQAVGQNEQTKKCDWCDGKGWYINENHPKYPKKLQKLDCYHCGGSGITRLDASAVP